MNNHLRVDLNPREDKHQQIFYLGKLQYPGFIDCSQGITFLIFLSEEGDEELQIASLDQSNSVYNHYTKSADRLKIALDTRKDQFDKVYYICKFQLNGLIDCRKEVSFIVFNTKSGSEQLQVVAPIVQNASKTRSKYPEIIVKKVHHG